MSFRKRYYRVKNDGLLEPIESPLISAQQQKQAQALAMVQTPASAPVAFDARTATPKQKEEWVYQTFQTISDHYDFMNDLESFGLHRAWKHALVQAVTGLASAAILDVASGTGDIALALAKANPLTRVTGFDFSQNMLEIAQKRATEAPDALDNLRFEHGNAMALPFATATFDAVTISFGLRNMPDYQRVVEEMTRVLKPGGSFFCLEASYPTHPLIKPPFKLYFKHIVPAIGALVTHKKAEYQWLNDSTEAFLSKAELATLMQNVGLANVGYRSFLFGSAALHFGIKPILLAS